MEREMENKDLTDKHDKNLQTEAESLRQDMRKTSRSTAKKKKGITSAFSAATAKATTDSKKTKSGK